MILHRFSSGKLNKERFILLPMQCKWNMRRCSAYLLERKCIMNNVATFWSLKNILKMKKKLRLIISKLHYITSRKRSRFLHTSLVVSYYGRHSSYWQKTTNFVVGSLWSQNIAKLAAKHLWTLQSGAPSLYINDGLTQTLK